MDAAIVTERKVPKSLLWWCWMKFAFFHMTCQTYDRGYTNAFTCAIIPILRYLYEGRSDADEQIREGLQRTRSYYLCEQSFSSVLFAMIVGMEEKKCNGGPVTNDVIAASRSSIMGPMSGLGDTLHGSTTRQISIALTLPFCLEGEWVAALFMLVLLNISPFLTVILGVPRGYAEGGGFVLKLIRGGKLQRLSIAASVAFMFVMGGTAGRYISIPLFPEAIRSLLESVLPGILAIGAILFYYFLLSMKITTRKLMVGTLVVGVLFYLLKIMG